MQYIPSWNKRKDGNACYRILLKICHITLESSSKMQQQKMLMQRSKIFFKMLLKIAASIRCILLIAYHKHSLTQGQRITLLATINSKLLTTSKRRLKLAVRTCYSMPSCVLASRLLLCAVQRKLMHAL